MGHDNELDSIIPSPRIFCSLTTVVLKEYLATSIRTVLLLNFNANTLNACADLSTCTISAVPLALGRAAYCGTLRYVAATTRNTPRGA